MWFLVRSVNTDHRRVWCGMLVCLMIASYEAASQAYNLMSGSCVLKPLKLGLKRYSRGSKTELQLP